MAQSNSKGIQAVLAGAGSAAATVAAAAGVVEGKPKAVLTALAAILAMLAAFSHPPTSAS
jgi:hypothetical protein